MTDRSLALSFQPDAQLGGEAYVCFGFDAGLAGGTGIKGVDWEHPGGDVVLHHAKLYAVPATYPAGPWSCDDGPPGAVPLHTWAPGAGPLRLPDGVAVVLPDDTASLVVEAHVLRFRAGDAATGVARLTLASAEDTRARAGWTARNGPVPALRPGQIDMSTTQCVLADSMHVFLAWPHEHLLGHAFQAAVMQAGGPLALLDVPTWDFRNQAAAVVDADVSAGDVLSFTCTWLNTTDHYVFAGPKTTDEMCGLGLIVSPPVGAALPCASP